MKKKSNRVFAAVLALVMLLSGLPTAVFAAGWDGTASAEPALTNGVYQISSPEELCWLALQVNGGNTSLNAALTADIDLNNQEWTPIANAYDAAYTGRFDGQGKVISGLSINATAAYQGLFGYIGAGATVENTTVQGSVTSNRTFLGGIAGRNAGEIRGCVSEVDVTNTNTSVGNSNYIGGIVGQNTGNVVNCRNSATVKGLKIGGVAGYLGGGTIAGCVNEGNVISGATASATTVGGIVGQIDKGAVYNCVNMGAVTTNCGNTYGSYYIGGIAGQASGSGAKYLFNCLNTGTVEYLNEPCNNFGFLYAGLRDSMTAADNFYLASAADESTGAVTRETLKAPAFPDRLNQNDGKAYGLEVDADMRFTAVQNGYPTPVWNAGEDAPKMVPVTAAAISGTAKAGEKLTASATGENGAAATKVAYQWQVSGDGLVFTDISGAVQPFFQIPEDRSYVGRYLRVVANGEEGSTAISPATGAVELSDLQKVADAKEKLTISGGASIKEATMLALPDTAENGARISWTSSDSSVIAPNGTVTLPTSGIANVTLTAAITYGAASDTKRFTFAVYSEAAVSDQDYVEAAKTALGDWYHLMPVYGEDTNVVAMVQRSLYELGYGDIRVSIKESDTAHISETGEITYFYADPNSAQGMWFVSTPVTFAFTKNAAKTELKDNVVIHWNADKARAVVQSEIADKVTENVIKGANPSLSEVKGNLVLPKVMDDKKWSLISWESSDPNVITIDASGQNTVETMFSPFLGKVKRGRKDQKVTLTATFSFQYATQYEPEITVKKTFEVTVKGLDGTELQTLMQSELNQSYTLDKLKDIRTGAVVDASDIAGDIQLPIPRSTGVADYGNYTFTVAADDTEAVSITGYRANVYRPLPGDAKKQVTLTVTMAHKSYNVSVKKTLSLTIRPLAQEEIDREIALMEAVKSSYFEGINRGANADAQHVKENLSAFQEAVADGSGVRFVYHYAQTTGQGIVPVSLDPAHPSEAWDKFYSSSSTVISHENLLVTRPEYDKIVTVSSCLSSQTMERYAVRYPENKAFARLYRQPVSAVLTVSGRNGSGFDEDEKTVSGTFTLVGDTAHGSGAHLAYPVWISGAPYTVENGATAMDVLREMLLKNGYSMQGGGYISSITTPGGVTLAAGGNGENSGWMYSVNGKLGDVYAGAYVLKDGDQLRWFYTDDYRADSRVENGDITVDTDVALPNYPPQWSEFRGSAQGTAAANGTLPTTAGEAKLFWSLALRDAADWSKSVSDPLLVNGHVYIAVGSELLVIDQNGQVLAKGKLASSVDTTCRPVYLDGKIIVPVSAGRLQALAADSMKTVWVSEALPPVQIDGVAYEQKNLSTLRGKDGYLYMSTACPSGSLSGYGTIQCVEAGTGHTVWQYENKQAGYYWSGAAFLGGAVLIAGDDGALLSLNAKTGAPIDRLPLGAAVRAGVMEGQDAVYAVSVDGVLHKVNVQPDGSFGGETSVKFASYSTSTPAILDGALYVGGRNEEKGVLSMIDGASMKVRDQVDVPAEIKASPLAVKAKDGTVAVYFTVNDLPGGLYAVTPGSPGAGAQLIYAPEGDGANYCMASVIADENGALYYTNDSGRLFAINAQVPVDKEKPSQPGEKPGKEPEIPKTGDTGLTAAAALLLSSAAVLLICRRKKEN